MMKIRERIRQSLSKFAGVIEALSIRTRFTIITIALLALALVSAAIVTQTLVGNFLTEQIDSQLRRGVSDVGASSLFFTVPLGADQSAGSDDVDQAMGLSDFVVIAQFGDGSTNVRAWPATTERYGNPDFTDVDLTAHLDAQPFSVPATGGESPRNAGWRVIARTVELPIFASRPTSGIRPPLEVESTQITRPLPEIRERPGVVYFALPLDSIHETTAMLSSTLWAIAALTVGLGVAASLIFVRRALRPLTNIEQTAAMIAQGELSHRIAVDNPRTEVGSLAQSLNTMLSQIELAFAERAESEKRMRQFVSDASHELRTPLATIRGYSELHRMMGSEQSTTQIADTFGRVEGAAIRMSTLVEDLLLLARQDEQRPMEKTLVSVTELVNDVARDLSAMDPQRLVRVLGLNSNPLGDREVLAAVDGDRIRQVLTNLIGNVHRYTPPASPVEFIVDQTTGTTGRQVLIEVRDHGPGVNASDREHLFERFFRVDVARDRNSGGSGLGLSIVAAIIAGHDGVVDLSETPGGGLTVRIELPVG
jgi:two-component system OmpR family sensor kinase